MGFDSNHSLKYLLKEEIYKINENKHGDIESLDSLGWALLIIALKSKGYEIELSSIVGLNNLDELIEVLKEI